MKQFINSLFEEKNRINFQYMDYNMSFYSEKFRSYYLLFYISSTEELVRLWENSGDIFESLKCCDEYHTDMDKNLCVYIAYKHRKKSIMQLDKQELLVTWAER